ncbi:hypothetical protein HG537_0F04740 [Torulaspora globosa]|uniref:Protein kinase domain-containing protein n=1 Tax=Torulaspora globosa TaxID=48254 RepID=A0A7H9HWN1_9SACH|nr:hypothetical protein HG537_0F04740 [Torulaspora sp. CBS 2947]
MHTVVGTPEYCAPEVGFKANREAYQCFSRAATLEQKGYDKKCDLWSLGVIAHIMLTGISPFYGDGTERSIIQNAKIGKLNFTAKQWCAVAESAKNFVRKLLEVDANKRLDCDESLRHPWISKHIQQLEKLYSKKILNSIETSKKARESDENAPKSDLNLDCTIEWKRKLPKSVAMDHTGPRKKKHRPGM